MYKDVLRSIDDVSLFPVIAILIFFVFFAILLVYVYRLDRQAVSSMASLPLSDSDKSTNSFSSVLSDKSHTS